MKLSENPSILGRPNVIVVMETSLFDILALNNVPVVMKYIFAISIREVNGFYLEQFSTFCDWKWR